MGTRAPRRRSALLSALAGVLLLTGCTATDEPTGTRAGDPPPSMAPSAPATFGKYVALGDSFTSAPLVPVTDVANGCFRSSANYPALVAAELGAELDDRSCGGATTRNFTRSQFPGVPAQFSALDETTDLVTVSIGGNDQQVFGRLVGRCPAVRDTDPSGAPCERAMTTGGRDRLVSAIRTARPRIIAAVKEIRRLAPKAKVLVVGYPQIASATDACPELPLATGDYAYAIRVNRALTETMEQAARATGSTYVDVWRASQGHDICSEDPWVNGAVTDQQRAARFHPFAEEQAAVAQLVLERLGR